MLSITWRTLISSPYSLEGILSDTSTLYSNPFSIALTLVILITSLITEDTSYSVRFNSNLPASILLKSSMSLIRDSRVLPAPLMLNAYFLVCSSLVSRIIISFIPRIPLRGVLISCDILARNSSLNWFAETALSASSRIVITCLMVCTMANIMNPSKPIAINSPEKTPL